jgi:hypothetical protein
VSTGPLADDVKEFVAAIGSELASLSGRDVTDHVQDATVEASNLIAAVIDADGRHTDDELWAYVEAVGPLLRPPLVAPPGKIREARLVDGRAAWLTGISPLAELFIAADAKHGTVHSHRYYEHVVRLAHLVAALDLVPSAGELDAIEGFRSALLAAFDAAGVPRPGQPRRPAPVAPAGEPPRPAPASGAAPPAVAATATPASVDAAAPPLPPARPIEELLGELDALVGLDHVKAEVRRLTSLLQVAQLRKERGLPTLETSHHLVFTGNPGTGKTTVARLLSQLYRTLGLVSKGHLVETDRSELVAGYVGQTATKTAQVLNEALGGTLLIDEAYALARGGENDFGREAIDTVVKFMEDHRDDLAIVAAGYPAEMEAFIDANPGLKSRFTRSIHFPDYTDDELIAIFQQLGDRNHYFLTDDALVRLRHLVATTPRDRGFGNARFMRNLFETAVAHQAARISPLTDPDTEQLTTLVASDIVPVDG